MSIDPRDELAAAIGLAAMRWQEAVETFDETVGRLNDLNSADRRCLSLVSQGPQTASAVARATALTPAAVTALIDRLEARGLVRRTADAADRRRVLVEATAKAQALIEACYMPTARAGAEMLRAYGAEELQAIRRFLADALALQARMTEELVARDQAPEGG